MPLSRLAPILRESVGQVKPEPQGMGAGILHVGAGKLQGRRPRQAGPRHRVDGDAGECGVLASYLRHRARRRWAFPGTRESEMGEDPLKDGAGSSPCPETDTAWRDPDDPRGGKRQVSLVRP